MTMGLAACCSALIFALTCSSDGLGSDADVGVSLNVDFGEGPLVEATEPGEAGQVGFWNRVLYAESGAWALLDGNGRNVGVRLSVQGASIWKVCTVHDYLRALAIDGVHSYGEPQVWTLTGLPNGDYGLLLYARPNCMADSTLVKVEGGVPAQRCFLANDEEARQSSFHLVRVRKGALTFSLHPTGPKAETRLVGLQVVPLSSSFGASPPRALACGDSYVVAGLGEDGSPWVHPLPRKGGSVLLSCVGELDGAGALRTTAWPGGRLVFERPQVMEKGHTALGLMSLVGRSVWCEAYARRMDGTWASSRKRILRPE